MLLCHLQDVAEMNNAAMSIYMKLFVGKKGFQLFLVNAKDSECRITHCDLVQLVRNVIFYSERPYTFCIPASSE